MLDFVSENEIKKMREVDYYSHDEKKRLNNPKAGLAQHDKKPDSSQKYSFDPNISPSLNWAGKKERNDFEVATPSIYTHEVVIPQRIIHRVQKITEKTKTQQLNLFSDESPLERIQEKIRAIEAYKHQENWKNRMIAGDSLVIMSSLINKESMSGQVQMIYFDPPYGIKYGSNFQPFVNKRDVKDKNDSDLNQEPEVIQAFRDTWELGIHSYLTYIRERLLLARELLADSGSVFIQISDENVHHVREICDEIFGAENFVSMINFRTAMTKPTKGINNVFDYIVWYAKDSNQYKYYQLYTIKAIKEEAGQESVSYTQLQASTPQIKYEFEYNGTTYNPYNGWRVTKTSLERLAELGRLYQSGLSENSVGSLKYIRYPSDFLYDQIDNTWAQQSSEQNKIYAVQTSTKVIQRCMLMTTDPDDLVLDITCGSGTTAYVAEQWGRRWVTCDTSRVALALVRQRLMTATFDYYKLDKPSQGISGGFVYKTVPHITLKSIANDEPPATEILYDQPEIDRKKIRITGPFTVESLPAPMVISVDEALDFEEDTNEGSKQSNWREQLLATGIVGKTGERIKFSRVELLQGTRYLNAEAEIDFTPPNNNILIHIYINVQ